MATIGSIDIGMSAQIGKLQSDFAAARTSIASFATGAQKAFVGLTAFAGVSYGLSAAKDFILGAGSAIDQLGDSADRLGTTTEALGALRYATQLTGSEASDLDGALTKMNNNLSDAALNGGPAAAALAKMGLRAEDLIRLDPADAFKAIAGGFQGIQNPAAKTAAAMDVFGKTGATLLNTLNSGPAELDRLSKEFKGLGGAVTEADRQTVGVLFDSLDRLSAAVGGVGNALAVQLAPMLTAAAEKVAAFGGVLAREGGVIETVFTTIGNVASVAFRDVIAPAAALAGEAFTTWSGIVMSGYELIRPAVEWIGAGIASAYEMATFALRNFGAILRATAIQFQEYGTNALAVVTTFGSNIVIVAKWIGRNWYQFITDGLNATAAAFTNFATNLGEIGNAVYQFFQDPTQGFQFEWKPLLDGFESTVEKFPELLKPTVVSMQDEIAAIFDGIGESEVKRTQEIAAAALKSTDAAKAKERPGMAAPDEKKPQFASALEMGSKEAYSAIIKGGMGGGRDKGLADVARSAREQLKLQGRMANSLDKIAGNTQSGDAELFALGA